MLFSLIIICLENISYQDVGVITLSSSDVYEAAIMGNQQLYLKKTPYKRVKPRFMV